MRGRGMTDAQKRRIIDAYLGTPLHELSEELGLTPDAIRRFALRQGLRKGERFEERRQAKEKCRTCQLFCNGYCIYHIEDYSAACRYMRYTVADWPKDKTPMQETFENI